MFNHIIIGGTFDHLHLGHKKLIETAFINGKRVTIGIVQRKLYKDKFLSQTIETFKHRKKSVEEFIHNDPAFAPPNRRATAGRRYQSRSISNIYGTTLTDKTIDSIVVSKATKKNAEIINQARKKINFSELKIIVVDDILAEDGKLITSERIRLGEIDQYGKSYLPSVIRNPQSENKPLILPEYMREELRRPFGKVLKSVQSMKFLKSVNSKGIPMIISVGDIVTQKLFEAGIDPDIKIIDFKTRRKKISRTFLYKDCPSKGLSFLNSFENKAGTINLKTAKKLKDLIQKYIFKKQKSWLVIDGEEDLLTLPAILLAPLDSLVFYGQWDKGAIIVEVTAKIKNQVKHLLERFI